MGRLFLPFRFEVGGGYGYSDLVGAAGYGS